MFNHNVFIQHCAIRAMVTVLLNSPRTTIINRMKEMLCGVHNVATALYNFINPAV